MSHLLRRSILFLAATSALGIFSQKSFADFSSLGARGALIKLPEASREDSRLRRLQDAKDAVEQHSEIRSLMRMARHSLSLAGRVTSEKLDTVKFQHYFDGLEVVGSMAMHHRGAKGTTIFDKLSRFDLDTKPQISAEEAIRIVRSLVGDRDVTAKPELKILPEAEGGNARLVYWVDLDSSEIDTGREVILDAHSGEILADVSKNIDLAPINVYNAKGRGFGLTTKVSANQIVGQPTSATCTVRDLSSGRTQNVDPSYCLNPLLSDFPSYTCQVVDESSRGAPDFVIPQNCTAQVINGSPVAGADSSAVRAAQNSQAVLNYYLTHHKRNSFDNRGSTVISVVHAGLNFDNAFWNTKQKIMVYGDGDGTETGDFTAALDVAGHEMTHGVVSETAKFTNWGESGALNEAFADFFGKMIANDGDWSIGRKLFLDQTHGKGFRDLADPSSLTFCARRDSNHQCLEKRPFPANVSQKMAASAGSSACDGTNDHCWVHANSTIPSHASYLVVQALGAAKAEVLYYAALTQSLTTNDNFVTAARSIKGICPQVLDSVSCGKVTQAYAQVGL